MHLIYFSPNILKIPFRIVERRPGDLANVYADASLAEKEMGWKAIRGLDEMCNYSETIKLDLDPILLIGNFVKGRDLWNWQSKNPKGFDV